MIYKCVFYPDCNTEVYECAACEKERVWSSKEGMEVKRKIHALKMIYKNHASTSFDIELFKEMFDELRQIDLSFKDEWFSQFVIDFCNYLKTEEQEEVQILRRDLNLNDDRAMIKGSDPLPF